MRPDLLDCLVVINNPIRWESRDRLFLQTVKHLLETGTRVTVVECAYGDIPYKYAHLTGNRLHHVGVRARTHVWIKESLLQIGLTHLPSDWKYVAWIDGDIHFKDEHWASELVYALQHWMICQPWSYCYDLGPHQEHVELHQSFCRVYDKQPNAIGKHGNGYTFAHPGYAWAATRQAMEFLGGFSLLQHAACGAGDHHLALALAGKVRNSVPGGIHPNYLAPLLELERRAMNHIAGSLHYLHGSIEHYWHGSKEHRFYKDRWKILTEHNYNPVTDTKINVNGVLELSGNKPALTRDLHRYFSMRREDGNVR